MYFNSITEDESVRFARGILDHYKSIDGNSNNHILTTYDIDSLRNNTGWYNYDRNKHNIFINIPNIMCAKSFVEDGFLTIDDYYAFLTLCTTHEFRHFLQGRCIYDGVDTDGYNQGDVFNADLMMYIRYFFDGYYNFNKENVKYELDAEKFAVENGIKFLMERCPGMDVETAMTQAVSFYAQLQAVNGFGSTLPLGCKSTKEIIDNLSSRLDTNDRNPDLERTLTVHSNRFYTNHYNYGLNEDIIINRELLEKYRAEKDGTKRDLLVANRILELLEKPMESLEQFPHLLKRYVSNNSKL